ncbi:helix-turn-helix transcriptional regulator [Streptomyces demainii]|uniref:DNA-binding transcriptional regulator AlpA n=1 Tax=Streptomyces demainii TaxID=588122 RepID=A0ABT9KK63_9ACTN|nr:helix-turn-helix domain-containing protein [Streptomyces demainii]MDP9608806.1 putative DNA-binding transcriptional regulator AlpA [Streptomyces demainii]
MSHSRRRTSAASTAAKSSSQKLKLPEVLAEIKMSRSAFYRMKARGKAPKCIKLPNGQIRVRRVDLDAWWEANEEASV